MTRSLIHVRIDDEHLERLNKVTTRLHISRTQALNTGMPFLLDRLEAMADALESTIRERE